MGFTCIYVEESLTHTVREIYTTGIRRNKKRSQRINVSAVTQNITDEVKTAGPIKSTRCSLLPPL